MSQFPGWGIEIMMGLYGEQSVKSAIEAEKPAATAPEASVESVPQADPVQQDLDAVSGMFRWLQRRRA
ncbi:hypothetical protein BFL43_05865 [Williamsia sp. 1135]|nr:hypothetical protein BFL43_05865 [Williamsia sp. 1135]